MIQFIKDLISKEKPESAMRFVVLFVYLFVILTVFIMWAVVSGMKQALQEFPAGLVTIIGLVLAIPSYFKSQEKKEETKQNADCTKSTLDINQKP
jgi:hypothetical protein